MIDEGAVGGMRGEWEGDPVEGNHSADMLMVYLPKEKILVNADLYSPRTGNAAARADHRHAHLVSEHAEAETGRATARADPRARRNE